MSPRILECEQRSTEWWEARMGIPTASEFHSILAKGEGKMRKTYMLKLAGEILTGEPMSNHDNADMERGRVMEDEARELYEFLEDEPLQRVGFIVNDGKGAFPDSLVGTRGALEIKTKLAHLQIECILRGDMPPEHKAQCQGVLWVAERDWIDIAVFWPKLPLFRHRAHRDEPYIKALAAEVERFKAELHEVVERVRSYGSTQGAKAAA